MIRRFFARLGLTIVLTEMSNEEAAEVFLRRPIERDALLSYVHELEGKLRRKEGKKK